MPRYFRHDRDYSLPDICPGARLPRGISWPLPLDRRYRHAAYLLIAEPGAAEVAARARWLYER